MLENLIHSKIGLFHTITAVLAMLFGTMVVLRTKGDRLHKRLGYTYVICMLALNISAFFIVNFDGFSIFHFFAIVSLITVLGGIIPAIRRPPNWFGFHYYFMSWSVVGLYCAFWAEVGTRFVRNMEQFWWAVALATFITAGIGSVVIRKQAKKLNFN